MSPRLFMDPQRVHYAVQQLCRVLSVVPSNYGPRRLPVELQEEDHRVDRHVLLMGLCRYRRRTLQPKAFTPRTNVFDLWPAVRPEFAARPAAPHPGQPVLGERHHVFALGQWLMGLPVRLSGRAHQARGGLAGAS